MFNLFHHIKKGARKHRKKIKRIGFTIIELVVVVSVIAVLSGIVIANVNQYELKARDARRVADIQQMQKALAMYFTDHGNYPLSGNGGANNWTVSSDSGTYPLLQTALQPYMSKLPHDPTESVSIVHDGSVYNYVYYSLNIYAGCKQNGYLLVYKREDGVTTPWGVTCQDGGSGIRFDYANTVGVSFGNYTGS